MNVKEEVLSYLEACNKIPGETEEQFLSCNYLDVGIVDSMGIVMMITEFEERFGMHFDSDDLQSYDFQTIGGLIGIIEKKLVEQR